MIRPDRLRVLRAIAMGERPEIQRRRIKWLLAEGWMARHELEVAPWLMAVTLAAKTWQALELTASDEHRILRIQSGGYRTTGTPR